MKTVTVRASRTYEVCIAPGLIAQVGTRCAGLNLGRRICIVSDDTVYPLYGESVGASLEGAGFAVSSFVFPAGEASKSAATYISLLNALANQGITREDAILALGGGVVGDLAGFAAATYLRGIRFVQVPTTVLAMVDSSVGGKTAIDLEAGKNLAGAFCQPSLVLCDTDTLTTLPQDTFRDGCAEIIKYGVLYDESLFALLEEAGLAFPREEVIARCVELKRNVVMEDEFDTGARMQLNLGHTVGHSIEAVSDFTVTHGKAVAMGMAIIARGTGCRVANRITALLNRFGLPERCAYTSEELIGPMLRDKKRTANGVKLIIPEAIGLCRVESVPCEDLKTILKAGL